MVASRDRVVGGAVAALSLVMLAAYLLILWRPPREGWDITLLKLTASIAVGVVAVFAAWIGYTIATTPPPPPGVEEVEREIEEEIKRLEEGENASK